MQWTQVSAISGSIIISMVGFVGAVYHVNHNDIIVMRDQMNRQDAYYKERDKVIDEKWERLFEKLLLQEKN